MPDKIIFGRKNREEIFFSLDVLLIL